MKARLILVSRELEHGDLEAFARELPSSDAFKFYVVMGGYETPGEAEGRYEQAVLSLREVLRRHGVFPAAGGDE